jgi:ubiquinone/menaquinone biosynthesis C-methylase UbiE
MVEPVSATLMRILEPELMDTRADAEGYDAMDFLEANTRFAEDALALVARRKTVQVLDVGTGTAQIPILMLRRRPDLKILAVDLAREMLRVAARNVADAGFAEACQLGCLDAKALRLPAGRYDLVVSNSTAHHIPEPLTLFREIARVVRPDGAVLVRDLVRPPSMEDAWATVKRAAPGADARQEQLFFDSLCAALTIPEVEALVRAAGLERVDVRRVSDRHWSAERRAQSLPTGRHSRPVT